MGLRLATRILGWILRQITLDTRTVLLTWGVLQIAVFVFVYIPPFREPRRFLATTVVYSNSRRNIEIVFLGHISKTQYGSICLALLQNPVHSACVSKCPFRGLFCTELTATVFLKLQLLKVSRIIKYCRFPFTAL